MTGLPYSTRVSMTLAATLAALFLVSQPWHMSATGIDSSWMAALEYSYLKGLVLGRDVSFTFGPLSFVYTRLFHPATFPWAIAAKIGRASCRDRVEISVV